MPPVETLVDLLRERAQRTPDQLAFSFLQDDASATQSITYAKLDQYARDFAVRLTDLGAAGEPVLLVFPAGLDFIVAFFGCLCASAIAVPCHPPRANQSLGRLQAVAGNVGARWALTSAAQLADFAQRGRDDPALAHVRWTALPIREDATDAGLWTPPSVTAGALAFVQYTSGSTGQPKGVMLTHGNLIHNEQMIQAGFGHGPGTIVTGWLPQFHDMGLIGNILQPIFIGAPCILMSPMAFLQRPIRWLRAISDHRATTSGGPNFAYELCVRKITDEQLEGVDLSSWTLAFSGAEPVRPRTLALFSERFAPFGFQRRAYYPCYGLAESTLFVTGPKHGEAARVLRVMRRSLEEREVVEADEDTPESMVQALVGCGGPNIGQGVAIVDPDRLVRCAPAAVGEIWVSGPSVAAGYWKSPELSARTFEARLADEPGRNYLRTGDLGFIEDGQLYVCGRLKDLIIIRGRNHAPEDIEWTAAQELKPWGVGSTVAFSVQDEEAEHLVLVHEIDRKALRSAGADALTAQLRRVVAHEHGLQLADLVFVKPASIPRTSSGKVQRHRCRAHYETGALSRLDLDALRTSQPAILEKS